MALTIENTLGAKGVYLMDGTHTALTDKNIIALYVQEDSTFTTLTDEDDTNVLTASNLSGKTVKAGALIGCRGFKRFKAVTVATGSVIGIVG